MPLLYAINSGTGRLEIQELPSYVSRELFTYKLLDPEQAM